VLLAGRARFGSRVSRVALAAAALMLAVWGWSRWAAPRLFGETELDRALTGRGRVLLVGASASPQAEPQGSTLLSAASEPAVVAALGGDDAARLVKALQQARIDALLVAPKAAAGTSLGARLARYERVDGLHGLYLARTGALYARDAAAELPSAFRDATAFVARGLLEGARSPNLSSFPEPLRRVRPVEVMVMLREGERARLWRSARGSSIASALITAAVIARQRWQEREQAMGGALATHLPSLAVEVALLEEDGTIAERDEAFIDRSFFEGHGVGYERKGAWRYLLPDATRREGKGKVSRAYRKLFVDDGLPADSFERHDLRLYRLVVQRLAVSPAPHRAASAAEPGHRATPP
jgi:hypothetical protein